MEATYAVHLRLIGKLLVDLLVIIELFSLGAFVLSIHAFDGRKDGQTDGFTIANNALAFHAVR